ncbi:MAG: 4Fe-4S cluster-binding domain-containing protein [Planctomycetota bacterium]|nr:MAG: 4Fe-4S cluster-binding domain-containing protein [Planctomycetota bacterium]REK25963.1 MAG: 4Fe-4S cluster-binding domain-containing protein [Planctomycetota bacterium]REK46921.1 MAG: 4Fe-4S cluster-binding domain-containing protein [Planctomycetota bacterium]
MVVGKLTVLRARIRLHSFLPHSRANGPGVRAVVWVQGCSLGCPGCFNPETHDVFGGEDVVVDELVDRIVGLSDTIEGVTVTGGEPLEQRWAVQGILVGIRERTGLSSIVMSGFTWTEIRRLPDAASLLEPIDVLIAGRFQTAGRIAIGMRGSANKTIHLLSDRYTYDDLASVVTSEIVLDVDGRITATGIDPVRLLAD